MLLVDFVSKGSKPGMVSDEVLKKAVAAPASELDYLIAKNSWLGETAIGDQLPVGTWRVTAAYLEKIAAAPLAEQKDGVLFVLVPKEAAEKVLKARPATSEGADGELSEISMQKDPDESDSISEL